MAIKVKGWFILLLPFTASLYTVTRKDEGDWFSGYRGSCHDLREYVHNSGCHCEHGLTFSSESMMCQAYEERGI